MRPVSQRRKNQAGFALLLVALMAAVAALMLYRELPRVAFQSQRQKEQMLVERGETYKRAIQLFYRTNKRWPASFEELESFNNKRYLRRRYKDPMTGKDDWRLIHIQGGVLTDSVNSKPPATQQSSNGTGIVAEIPLVSNGPQQGGGVNPALRRRPSDGGASVIGPDGQPINPAFAGGGLQGGFAGMPGVSGPTGTTGLPGMSPFPGGVSPTAINGNGANGVSGVSGAAVPGAGGVPGMLGIPTVSPNGQNGSQQSSGGLFGSGSGSLFGGAPQQQNGVQGQNGVPGAPGVPGVPGVPGQPYNPNGGGVPPIAMNPQAQASAAQMLNSILTTPRPGGLAGIQAAQQQSANTVGGGIAGVASKYDADSIMVYTDKTNFAEWEFTYDPSKEHAPPNPMQGTVGTLASNLNSSNASTGGLFAGGAGGSTSGVSIPGQASGSAPTQGGSQFGNSFSLGGSGAQPGMAATGAAGGPPGMGGMGFGGSQGIGGSGLGQATPGVPGAAGATGMPGAAAPGGASFGGGGGVDIRPGRAN